MIFDLYFNISKTSIELLALGLLFGAGVYVMYDLIEREEEKKMLETVEE